MTKETRRRRRKREVEHSLKWQKWSLFIDPIYIYIVNISNINNLSAIVSRIVVHNFRTNLSQVVTCTLVYKMCLVWHCLYGWSHHFLTFCQVAATGSEQRESATSLQDIRLYCTVHVATSVSCLAGTQHRPAFYCVLQLGGTSDYYSNWYCIVSVWSELAIKELPKH